MPSLEYLVFPVIVWIALRLGQREVIVAVTLVSSVAIAGAIHDRGPFVTDTLTQRLVLLQLFMAVVATTALALGALVTERRGAYEEVRRANATKDQFLAVLSHELRTQPRMGSSTRRRWRGRTRSSSATRACRYASWRISSTRRESWRERWCSSGGGWTSRA